MFTVKYTSIAEEDLVSILNYLSDILKAPSAAKNLLDEIEKQTKVLENNPCIFPFAKDEYFKRKNIRHMNIKNYVLFYTIEEDKELVTVIRIMYARRDWIHILKND